MAEAKLNREYALRIFGVGAVMFGMCVWSLYDGHTAWPRQNLCMDRARPMLLATNLTAEAWLAREEGEASPLEAAFRAVGEKTPSKLVKKIGELRVPKSAENANALHEAQAKALRKTFEGPVYSAHDLQTQTVQAVITFVLGACAWLSLVGKARKRFLADETGLHGSGVGGDVPYDAIARIDWSKWDDKGIVVLTLASGRKLKLDGWHFADMTGIVDEIKRGRPDLAPEPKSIG